MDNRHKPMPGELYRHFKGKLYQIVSVATHTETEEELVVYQALYGDFGIYARPLTMFMSKVDTVKYAEVTAVYRFELYKTAAGVVLSAEDIYTDKTKELVHKDIQITQPEDMKPGMAHQKSNENISLQQNTPIELHQEIEVINSEELRTNLNENGISTILMEFLDATSFRDKLEIIQSYKKDLTDKIINDMAMSIDCTVMEGDMDERIASLIYCLQTRIRFEGRRFR